MSEMHNFDIRINTEFGDEDENERRAVRRTQALLQSWRGRFVGGDQDDTPISKNYAHPDGGQVYIASPGMTAVSVTHMLSDDESLVFAFGVAESGTPYLDVGGLPETAEVPTPLTLYDMFSRYLFDADRSEVRG